MIKKLKLQTVCNGASLFRGDARHLLRSLPDKSVDLTVTSPPYCIGKEYESSTKVGDFIETHLAILPEIVRVTKDGGSICWQTGYHVTENSIVPLDYHVFEILRQFEEVRLRNRIVWHFGHGVHASKRFSGRHEVVLWFTKGREFLFDLDAVRIQQKYPGKKHYKGPKKGEYSGNPAGKNPSDVWLIPNVNANHVEKTVHPCQFPIALALRLVRALTKKGQTVLDPFAGTGSTGVAALIEKRRFIGAEMSAEYCALAKKRLIAASQNKLPYRALEQTLFDPVNAGSVAKKPPHFS